MAHLNTCPAQGPAYRTTYCNQQKEICATPLSPPPSPNSPPKLPPPPQFKLLSIKFLKGFFAYSITGDCEKGLYEFFKHYIIVKSSWLHQDGKLNTSVLKLLNKLNCHYYLPALRLVKKIKCPFTMLRFSPTWHELVALHRWKFCMTLSWLP